jgi:hypothetical protein
MSRIGRLVLVTVVASLLVFPAMANARPVSTFRASALWQNSSITVSQLESGAVSVDFDHFVSSSVSCGTGTYGVLIDQWVATDAVGSGPVVFDPHLASATASVTFVATHTWEDTCNGGSVGEGAYDVIALLTANANDRANRGRDSLTGTRFIARTAAFDVLVLGTPLRGSGMLTEEIAQG